MNRFLCVFTIFIVLPTFSIANAGYFFKILLTDGEVSVIQSNGTSKPAEPGIQLKESDQIRLSDGAYCGIIHISGKTKEITKKGTYMVSELAKAMTNEAKPLSVKYGNIFIKNLKSTGFQRNRRQHNYNTVSVAADSIPEEENIRMFLPSSVEVLSSRVQLWWKCQPQTKTYFLNVKNQYDEILLTMQTTDSTIVLDLENEKIKNEKLWIVGLAARETDTESADEYGIKLKDDVKGNLQKELNALRGGLNLSSPLDLLILAAYYEHNNLWPEALMYVSYACEAQKGKNAFQEVLQKFLLRSGFQI